MPVNPSNGDSIHMPADYYIVKVRDFGEDYAYPYESLEEAQDFMTQCKLPRTLWACSTCDQWKLCEHAAE